jgi:hypothetical protein
MPLARDELERRLAAQPWTAHNIRLTPEVVTIPGRPDFLEADPRLAAVVRTLSVVYRRRLQGLRAVDLGCLEGGFALGLARQGMHVLGVEARQINLDKTRLLTEHFGLSNLEFRRDDVKRVTRERYGTFDVVLALGILYHLDRPVSWLRQLAELTRGVLVIESHYAPADEAALAGLDPQLGPLGPLSSMEEAGAVYEGRWYVEYEPGADPEPRLWASYSNHRSFWLTKESLLRAVLGAGFDLVWEQHDYSAADYRRYNVAAARGLFCALKTGSL